MNRRYKTPYFIMKKESLQRNLEKLSYIEKASGVVILHTVKSFNQGSVLPLIASKLSGMSVGSLREYEMAQNAHAKHIHFYAPAFREEEILEVKDKVSTISFNSLAQWRSFSRLELEGISLGIRINPKLHLPIPSYCNPNLAYSRLGVDGVEFMEEYMKKKGDFKKLEGLHFHALFQSSVEGLTLLFDHILQHYSELLPGLKWLNLGGGHNFTDDSYDTQSFIMLIKKFNQRFPHIRLYFEPGEAVVKRCGEFISTVLDIVTVAERKVVILDTSIETHLLDVAIVNQRLRVKGTQSCSTPYFYELAGNSCLQGDIIGEYFFMKELHIGDRVIFEDMMGYSMVKMTEFNGMKSAEFIFT